MPLSEALQNYVEEPGPLPTPCHRWQGAVTDSGYGSFGKYLAHRASYEAFVGPIPEGIQVNHACDLRLCINPSHLHLGTHQSNSAEMVERGRSCKGSRNGSAVINEQIVSEILQLLAEGRKQWWVAEWYGVHFDVVSRIALGQRWQHVPGIRTPTPPPPPSSRFLGVIYIKDSGKWRARLTSNGIRKNLGSFNTEIEAAACVNDYIVSHGLNRPLNDLTKETEHG
jgi:HNH endonuclease